MGPSVAEEEQEEEEQEEDGVLSLVESSAHHAWVTAVDETFTSR